MNIIFNVEGGIGKSIMATAVCEAIKKQYPNDDLIVLTSYPEVFICNPNVKKTINHNNLQYFYKDYIENGKAKLFLHNPYLETDFVYRKEHCIKTWCKMFGLKYNNEQPKLYLTKREIDFYSNSFISEKPIFVMQTNGGGSEQINKYSWARDIPINLAQEIVDEFSIKYNVFHIRRDNQFQLSNTKSVNCGFRELCVLIMKSEKRLFMDSFSQHTAKAFNLESVVLWIANIPSQFGYSTNINIQSNDETVEPDLKFSVFNKYNITGGLTEFPFKNEDEIFNKDEIINAINNQS